MFSFAFLPDPPSLELARRVSERAWAGSPARFAVGAAQGDDFQGWPKPRGIVLRRACETRAGFAARRIV